jgi:hypothetical protein
MKVKKVFIESLARTDSNLPELNRTSELDDSDFLVMFSENCKIFHLIIHNYGGLKKKSIIWNYLNQEQEMQIH